MNTNSIGSSINDLITRWSNVELPSLFNEEPIEFVFKYGKDLLNHISSYTVAITTAKLGDASVNTLKIVGNAVTIPVSSSSTNHVSIVSIDCGTEGLTVCVMATTSGYITPPDGVTTHYLVGTLYRNGAAIASTNFASGSFAYSGRPGFGVCSFNTTISGLTGVNTFTVQISGAVGSDSWGGGRSGIIALGVKR